MVDSNPGIYLNIENIYINKYFTYLKIIIIVGLNSENSKIAKFINPTTTM